MVNADLVSSTNKFSDGLCDCFNDCDTCNATFWCQPIAIGQLASRYLAMKCAIVASAIFLLWAAAIAITVKLELLVVQYNNDPDQSLLTEIDTYSCKLACSSKPACTPRVQPYAQPACSCPFLAH